MTTPSEVSAHYTSGDLLARLEARLREDGVDPARPTIDALAPYDHFHGRGVEATEDMANRIEVAATDHVLDVGSGLGGPARYFARRFGCQVSGIDLTAEFCEVARHLTSRLGLGGRVSFEPGDALSMPFDDAAFDGAYSMNVSMNIADKRALYREIRRVLKPGGWLVLSEAVQGPGGEPDYPEPWARTAATSFLATAEETRANLAAVGFTIESERDTTEDALAYSARARALVEAGGKPPHRAVSLILGPLAEEAVANTGRALRERRTVPVEFICRKVPGHSGVGTAMMSGPVTVFGGSGFLGRRIVGCLAAEGCDVRVGVRHPERASSPPRPAGSGRIEVVRADVWDEPTVARAVEGAASVINTVGHYVEKRGATFDAIHGRGAQHVARQAKEAGAARLVHISGLGADPGSDSPYVRARGIGEEPRPGSVRRGNDPPPERHLRAGRCLREQARRDGTQTPVLRSCRSSVRAGRGSSPSSSGDVAEACAKVLADPSSQGRVYEARRAAGLPLPGARATRARPGRRANRPRPRPLPPRGTSSPAGWRCSPIRPSPATR